MSSGLLVRPPAHLAWQKLQPWTLCANFSTKFSHTCLRYRHGRPLSLHAFSVSLTLTRSVESESCGANFLARISTSKAESSCNTPTAPRGEIFFSIKGCNCCFIDCVKKKTVTATCILTFMNRFLSTMYDDSYDSTTYLITRLSDLCLNFMSQVFLQQIHTSSEI